MKSNKKFPPALGAIVEQALKDNTAWIGKTVLEITCEAIKKHDLSQEDAEGMVCLTVDEAKDVLHSLNCTWSRCPVKAECKDLVKKKIEQTEGKE